MATSAGRKKLTLAEQLAELNKPLPEFEDPDEAVGKETLARVVDKDSDADEADTLTVSSLRRRNVSLLSDHDRKYSGKAISRTDLDSEYGSSSDDGGDTDESGEEAEIGSPVNDSAKEENGFHYDGDFQDLVDDEDKDLETGSDGEYESADEDSEISEDGHREENGGKVNNATDNTKVIKEGLKTFSAEDIQQEVEKGLAIKNQLSLWESLLELRIQLQKSMALANQLPQPTHGCYQRFRSLGGQEFADSSKQSGGELKSLLHKLLEVQTALLPNHPDHTSGLLEQGTRGGGGSGGTQPERGPSSSLSDEEITSEESEGEEAKVQRTESVPRRAIKRKLEIEGGDYGRFLAKRHGDLEAHRNAVIQKWSDKTRLASGKLNKGFGAFDRSVLSQIAQILGDRDRLVRRTQLKRSVYRVLGKPQPQQNHNSQQQDDSSNTNAHLKDYDEEIFDDSDFYHQLLRELIEQKTIDTNDPIALGRQWLEIQKLRSKVKKHVDTKASKGRKIRYDTHPKLVSFMAPLDTCTMSAEARNELYKSLFGHTPPPTNL